MDTNKQGVSRWLSGFLHTDNRRLFGRWIVVAALLNVSFHAHGINLGVYSDEPIKISADRAKLEDKTGISTYTGNVIITQGKSKLLASQIVVYADDDGIRRFVASGNLAHLIQYERDTDTETHAYAREITYERDTNQVILRQNARLEQESSSFQGDEIYYDTVKRVVTAESGKKGAGSGRVEIIYQPPKASK